MTTYEALYPGAENFLMPKYVDTEYQSPVEHFGMSLDPRTANQLRELNTKINPGIKHIEVQGITPGVFESIPEQHLEEMRRSAKLAGSTLSLHGPLVEASGVGERGWDEANRVSAEQQLKSAILRSHKLDPKGNISVTLHSTAQLQEMKPMIKTKKGEEPTGLWVVNPESGQIGQIPKEKRYFPEEEGEFKGKAREFDPMRELKKLNEDQWTEQLSNVNRFASYGEDILERVKKGYQGYKIPEETFSQIARGVDIEEIKDKDVEDKDVLKSAQREINHGQIYLRDSYRNMKTLFDRAWANSKEGSPYREELREFAQKVAPDVKEGIEHPEKVIQLREVVEKGLKVLSRAGTVETFKPLNEFVIEQSARTFANVAESAFNKFGDTAPIINIENPPAGAGLSKAEDLRNLVKATRKQLAENLTKKGMSQSQAQKVSEKMIGATWDVGHINMLRKYGYTEEDIIKETEKIAPFVKHAHLSDNFGLEHTELPMGMGNVPTKEILEKLKKKGFDGKKIIEAGNWWQYFAEQGGGNPFKPSIEAFDSPIYAMKAGPTWSEAGMIPGYFGGHGPINPPVHHRVYGAGFEALPVELGGEMPGDRGRFAGTPNQ